MPTIQEISSGDFVNQGRDKFNLNFGFVPVAYAIDAETGDLLITLHNEQQIRVPLANFFATLAQVTDDLMPGLATPDKAGLVLLVDDEVPEHLNSEARVATAATMLRLITKALYQITDPLIEGQRVALTINEETGEPIGYNVDPDTLQDIMGRGLADKKGWTDLVARLMGGLYLDQIPDLPPNITGKGLVLGSDKRVYKGNAAAGGARMPTPVLVFGQHMEAVAVATDPPFTVPANSPPLVAGNMSGSLDIGNCDFVGGWISKRDNLSATGAVDIYANGTKVASNVPGNLLRADVATAIGSADNKYFGFGFEVPASLRTGTTITWKVCVAGTQTELTFSPKTSNVCGIAQVSVKRTYLDGPSSRNEGGATGTYVLKQEKTDGTITTIKPDSFSLSTNIPGVTITQGGVLTPGTTLNTIANNVTIGVRATLGASVIELPVIIINANATNPAPTVTPFPDQVVTATGDVVLNAAGTFTDTDGLTVVATDTVGNPLPAGINFDPATNRFTVAANYPNGSIAIRQRATDTAGNSVIDDFLLTINRPVVPTRTQVGIGIVGSNFINEGASRQYRLIATFDDGTTEDRTNLTTKTLEGWRPNELIDNEGTVTIPANSVVGDGHELTVVMIGTVTGTRYSKSVQVVDVSTTPAPANKVLTVDQKYTGDNPPQYSESSTIYVKTAQMNGAQYSFEWPAQDTYLGPIQDAGVRSSWYDMQPISNDPGGAQYVGVTASVAHILTFYVRCKDTPADVVTINIVNTAAPKPRTNVYTAPAS